MNDLFLAYVNQYTKKLSYKNSDKCHQNLFKLVRNLKNNWANSKT